MKNLAGPARPALFLYHLFWTALDWLLPPICGGCQRPGVRWCDDCQQKVARILPPICPCCGDPQAGGGLCSACQNARPVFQALRSYGVFQSPLRDALRRLKYQQDIGLGESLSKHLIELYNEFKWEIDLVVPVPLSPRRYKERGYNQSGLLGRPLAYALGRAYLPGVLKRTRETRTQVGLSAIERRINVEDAFSACVEQVKGKNILVVDDVTTTGSTIGACAQALCQAGASAVYGLTLARAVIQTHTDDQPNHL